jgi:hypothetical protein
LAEGDEGVTLFAFPMHLISLERSLWYLNIAAAAGLFLRLYAQRILTAYPFVFALLIAVTVEQFVALASIHNPRLYLLVYILGQTVKLPLGVFAVLEVCQRAVANRLLSYAFCLAIPVSLANLLLDAGVAANCDPILFEFLKVERTVNLILGLVISVVLFGLPMLARRNVVLWLGGFMVYSLSRWAGLLLTNLQPHYTRGWSVGMQMVSLACLAGWTILLKATGERETASLRFGLEDATPKS